RVAERRRARGDPDPRTGGRAGTPPRSTHRSRRQAGRGRRPRDPGGTGGRAYPAGDRRDAVARRGRPGPRHRREHAVAEAEEGRPAAEGGVMSLRTRVLLSFVPLALLLVALGAAGFVLLDRMGGRIDAILKENYASVQAMFRLNEALERIDSSF